MDDMERMERIERLTEIKLSKTTNEDRPATELWDEAAEEIDARIVEETIREIETGYPAPTCSADSCTTTGLTVAAKIARLDKGIERTR